MQRKFFLLAVLALALLLLTSPAPLRALELEPAGLSAVILPAGSISIKLDTEADFKQDGSLERLLLDGGRLTILSAGQPVWQSPAAWTGANPLQRESIKG